MSSSPKFKSLPNNSVKAAIGDLRCLKFLSKLIFIEYGRLSSKYINIFTSFNKFPALLPSEEKRN